MCRNNLAQGKRTITLCQYKTAAWQCGENLGLTEKIQVGSIAPSIWHYQIYKFFFFGSIALMALWFSLGDAQTFYNTSVHKNNFFTYSKNNVLYLYF